jgi:hypothetical protein
VKPGKICRGACGIATAAIMQQIPGGAVLSHFCSDRQDFLKGGLFLKSRSCIFAKLIVAKKDKAPFDSVIQYQGSTKSLLLILQ